MQRFAGPGTRMVDAGGRSVIPGPGLLPAFYAAVLLTPKAQAAVALNADNLPAGISVERDGAGADQDFFSVPVDRIGGTVSLLTVVGGKVACAAGPWRARCVW